ncbi:MAG: SOS response-associated peptidase family protein [Oscillospiraceae bacterium]|nr:SOS response-associated peptidase family protein [Oscillospiraceae bacterium]
MCGRYEFADTGQDEMLAEIIARLGRSCPGACKTGEIFPGDTAPAVIVRNGKIVPVPAVFGFPAYEGGRLIINARSETAAEKKSFSGPLREARAVIPANGFYEWSHNARKTKYLFDAENRSALYLCGIWRFLDGQYRFVILTRAADPIMKPVHDRMPVIIGRDSVRAYLTDYAEALRILQEAPPTLRKTEQIRT